MFEITEPEARGFSGRPLLALAFAVGLGVAAYQVGAWLRLNDFAVLAIIILATVVVGYAWEWLDTPRCSGDA